MTGHFDNRFLDDVRARIGLVDLIGADVQLRRNGREFWGLCPFHAESTPSFSVNEDKGFAYCFGCGRHGDAIGWIMETRNPSFTEAVNDLAISAGLRADESGRDGANNQSNFQAPRAQSNAGYGAHSQSSSSSGFQGTTTDLEDDIPF